MLTSGTLRAYWRSLWLPLQARMSLALWKVETPSQLVPVEVVSVGQEPTTSVWEKKKVNCFSN